MIYKTPAILLAVLWILAGTSYAVEDQSSLGTQAGEAARQLKNSADETYAIGTLKVKETEEMARDKAQDVFRTLQEQWDSLSLQLQKSTQQMSQQFQKQLEDFQKSFNQSDR